VGHEKKKENNQELTQQSEKIYREIMQDYDGNQ
jgi:hypothetical protein